MLVHEGERQDYAHGVGLQAVRARDAIDVELELSAARLRLVARAGEAALAVVKLLRDAGNVVRAPALSA